MLDVCFWLLINFILDSAILLLFSSTQWKKLETKSLSKANDVKSVWALLPLSRFSRSNQNTTFKKPNLTTLQPMFWPACWESSLWDMAWGGRRDDFWRKLDCGWWKSVKFRWAATPVQQHKCALVHKHPPKLGPRLSHRTPAPAERAPRCCAEPAPPGKPLFPWKGRESLEISNKPLPADCAAKENTDVIQWTMRNPNLAQWSFWLCFPFQQLCTALITFTGAAFAETRVCKFFACVKNPLLLYMNTGTSRLWHGETHLHSTIKSHVTSLAYCPHPFLQKYSPKWCLRVLGLETELRCPRSAGVEGVETPAPSTAGEGNCSSEIIHSPGFQSTHFFHVQASLSLVNRTHFGVSASRTLQHKGSCTSQMQRASSSVQEQVRDCGVCRCKQLRFNAAERGCKHQPPNSH